MLRAIVYGFPQAKQLRPRPYCPRLPLPRATTTIALLSPKTAAFLPVRHLALGYHPRQVCFCLVLISLLKVCSTTDHRFRDQHSRARGRNRPAEDDTPMHLWKAARKMGTAGQSRSWPRKRFLPFPFKGSPEGPRRMTGAAGEEVGCRSSSPSRAQAAKRTWNSGLVWRAR